MGQHVSPNQHQYQLHSVGNPQEPPDPPTLHLDRILATDTEYLRSQLADLMEAHPPSEWSAPFLMALIGLFDAHLFGQSLKARELRRSLRIAN